MTFSIVGYDPMEKEWGIAVQSKFLGVGAVVPWAKAGAGAVATQSFATQSFATQSFANTSYGLMATSKGGGYTPFFHVI